MQEPETCGVRNELVQAGRDYKYLLNRGYTPQGALDLVTSRYLLTKEERMLLYRCIHPEKEAEEIRKKTVPASSLRGKELVIDGYNALLTIASAIEGRCLYLCDDGYVRDLRSAHIKDFGTPSITQAIDTLIQKITEIEPKHVTIYLDKNVSKSLHHKTQIEEKTRQHPNIEVKLATKADTEIMATKGIISTSDIVILKKAHKTTDIAGTIVKEKHSDQIINLPKLIQTTNKI